ANTVRWRSSQMKTVRLQRWCEALMTTVWIYVDTSKSVGDPNHLKVFVNRDAADAWFVRNDPEGVAFEYDLIDGPWPTFETEISRHPRWGRRDQRGRSSHEVPGCQQWFAMRHGKG